MDKQLVPTVLTSEENVSIAKAAIMTVLQGISNMTRNYQIHKTFSSYEMKTLIDELDAKIMIKRDELQANRLKKKAENFQDLARVWLEVIRDLKDRIIAAEQSGQSIDGEIELLRVATEMMITDLNALKNS